MEGYDPGARLFVQCYLTKIEKDIYPNHFPIFNGTSSDINDETLNDHGTTQYTTYI